MAGLESCDDARLYGKSYVGVGQSYVNARLHQKYDPHWPLTIQISIVIQIYLKEIKRKLSDDTVLKPLN